MNALTRIYWFIVSMVTARRFYKQSVVAGVIFCVSLGTWALQRSDVFYPKLGLVIGRTAVLDPDTGAPILIIIDERGEEVEEIGPQVAPYDDMTIWNADAYRAEVAKYRTFIQEEADGLAQGHCLVSIENYGSEHCGSATVTVAASTPDGQSEQVPIQYPSQIADRPNVKYVVLRNSSTIIDPRLLGEDGPVLLTSSINLNSIDESVVNDTNIRSLLLTENGIVERSTEHNISYRTGYFEPTDDLDAERSSRILSQDRDRALGPIAGAKVYSSYDFTERFATYTDQEGAFRVEYFLPPCPCSTFSYDGDLWAEIPYRNYNPLNSEGLPFASFFVSTPTYDFCSGYHYCFLLPPHVLASLAAIHATTALPPGHFRRDIKFDAMIITGEGQVTDENGNTLPIGDTIYTTDQQGNFDNQAPASLAFDFDLDRQTDNAVLHNGEYYVYLGGREVETDEGTGDPINEDLRRRPDQLNDYQDWGLLESISIEDLKETDLYIYRVSTGELIVERQNLKPEEYARLSSGGTSSSDNQFFYRQLMRGPRVLQGSLNNRLTDWWSDADIKIELFDNRYADFLRLGEEVQIIAINRPTGYIGSTIAKLQFNTETGANTLDVPIDTLRLRPPNLKIRAERRTETELGLTKGEINDYLISSEGAGLTSDQYIAIKTEWFDHDGSALPSDLPGYSGTLAKIVGNQKLGSDSACTSSASPISIKPGSRIQLLKLGDNCDLGKEHYYVYICGHNKADSARDKCFSFGNTNDIGRPKYYVPVKVPLYDEIASRQQYNAYRYGQQDGIIGEEAEAPEPVYRWHYRPEMQFSVYELEIDELRAVQEQEDGTQDIIDLLSQEKPIIGSDTDYAELLFNLLISEGAPLDSFGPDRELVFAFGEDEVLATVGEDQSIQFENLSHLGSLQPEDFLSLRLYANNDAGNVLWEFAFGIFEVTPNPLPLDGVTRVKIKVGTKSDDVPRFSAGNMPAFRFGGNDCEDVRQDEYDVNTFYCRPPASPSDEAGKFGVLITGLNIPSLSSNTNLIALEDAVEYIDEATKGVGNFSTAIGVSIEEAESMASWAKDENGLSGDKAADIFMDRMQSQVSDGMDLMKNFMENKSVDIELQEHFLNLREENNLRTLNSLTFLGADFSGSGAGAGGNGVNVVALESTANESTQGAAAFLITRPVTQSILLEVHFSLESVALFKTDYYLITNFGEEPDIEIVDGDSTFSISIPVNKEATVLFVVPIADGVDEPSESLSVKVLPRLAYGIGVFNEAVAEIVDSEIGEGTLGSYSVDDNHVAYHSRHYKSNQGFFNLIPMAMAADPPILSYKVPSLGSSTFFSDVKDWMSVTGKKIYVGANGSSSYAVFNADDFNLYTQTYTTVGKTIDNAVTDNPDAAAIINGAFFNYRVKEPLITAGIVYNNKVIQSGSTDSSKPSHKVAALRYWFGQDRSISNSGQAKSYRFGGKGNPPAIDAAIGGLISSIWPNASGNPVKVDETMDSDLSVFAGFLGPLYGHGMIGVDRDTGMVILLSKQNKSYQDFFGNQSLLFNSGVDQAIGTDGGSSVALHVNSKTLIRGQRHQGAPNADNTVTNYFLFKKSE